MPLKICMVGLDGRRHEMTARALVRLVLGWRTTAYFFLAVIGYMAFDADAIRSDHGSVVALLFWAFAGAVYVVMQVAQMFLMGWLLPGRATWMPLIGIPSAAVTAMSHSWVSCCVLGAGSYDTSAIIGLILYNYTRVQVFETVWMLFVLPESLKPVRQTEAAVPPGALVETAPVPGSDTARDMVFLGDHGIRVDLLRYVRVADHMLEIHSASGTETIRARLRDLVGQLGEDARGFQMNRSEWIAARHVLGVTRDGTRDVAVLRDGTTVVAARPRLADFRVWVTQMGLPDLPGDRMSWRYRLVSAGR